MEYFTFGMKKLRVTQNYNGTTSHKPHWYKSKDYADYPIDIAGKDGNKDNYYATVDMKVNAVRGIGTATTNTIWLETVDEVQTPSGVMKVFIALTHFNDKDKYASKLKKGDIVKKGSAICQEGVDGATANHLHMICGNASKETGDNLITNSNGKAVSNGYCMKPEKLMYIDPEFTEVLSKNGIKFKTKPKEKPKKENFFPKRGYFKKGDSGKNVEKINDFYYNTFPAYDKVLGRNRKDVLGDYFGENTEAWTKEFQSRTGLEPDGCIGVITLSKLKEFGFKE